MATTKNKATTPKSELNEVDLLNNVLAEIRKQSTQTQVNLLTDIFPSIKRISSGSFMLDLILGGGFPVARVTEIFGKESSCKTGVCLSHIAKAQEIDPNSRQVFIDAEHTFDPTYAQMYGVDLSRLILHEPSVGENVFDDINRFLKLTFINVIVIDSAAALCPSEEFENDMSKNSIGLHGRMFSKGFRKISPVLAQSNATLIFINQIREKVGVMYGCLHASTIIPLVDGRTLPIKYIVDNKINGQVWSYNETTNTYEPKDITDWHFNGIINKPEDYIHITCNGVGSKNGIEAITVTQDHQVLTQSGWKAAKDIKLSDKIATKAESKVNGTFSDFLYGILIGDSHLAIRSINTACLKLQDNKNKDYLNWKLHKLAPIMPFRPVANRFETQYTPELKSLKDEIENRNPLIMLWHHYSDMGLALWIMDDGHYDNQDGHNRYSLSIKRFKQTEQLTTVGKIFSKMGLTNSVNQKDGSVYFTAEATDILASRIAKYVPSCMQYKLPEKYHGLYEDFTLSSESEQKIVYTDVISIRYASSRQFRQKGKYDISVADNHNYIAGGTHNGIVVHNSPETTPGGRALKFYSAVRLKTHPNEPIKNSSGEQIGLEVKATTAKNKTFAPNKTTTFRVIYGEGVDVVEEIANMAIMQGEVIRKGAWINDKNEPDTLKWNGKEKFLEALHEDSELFEKYRTLVNEKLHTE